MESGHDGSICQGSLGLGGDQGDGRDGGQGDPEAKAGRQPGSRAAQHGHAYDRQVAQFVPPKLQEGTDAPTAAAGAK